MPADVNNHYHDDAEPWKSASDGRWYTFVSGGNMARTHGVNMLYSTTEADFVGPNRAWTLEHALWNITDGQSTFVSCPEMYPLPGHSSGQPRTSGPVVYEQLGGGGDRYWLGVYDDDRHVFTPDPQYVPPQIGSQVYLYDYGVGKASKSFWDSKTNRRIMWSWITGRRLANTSWDGAQSVPRHIAAPVEDQSMRTSTGRARELKINPIEEVTLLRDSIVCTDAGTLPAKNGTNKKCGNQLDLQVNFTWEASVVSSLEGLSAGLRVLVGDKGQGMLISFSIVNKSAGFMPNTNLPGGDIVHDDFPLNRSMTWTDQTGSAQCAAFCANHSTCTGWTYVRPAPQGNGPRCAIKGAGQTLPPKPDMCCVSGYKPGQPHNITSGMDVAVSAAGSAMPGHFFVSPDGNAFLRLRVLMDHSIVEVYDSVAALSAHYIPFDPHAAVNVQMVGLSDTNISYKYVAYSMRSAVI